LIRGELEVLEIPGNHTTMLQEPHVRRLASALSALLEGAAVQR
jgi:thioesterase domain-containing protein